MERDLWSWAPINRTALAKYVTPELALRSFGHKIDLGVGVAEMHRLGRQAELVAAIYEELRSRRVYYASELLTVSPRVQRIRSADLVLSPGQGRGEGTCLDLVLAMCGVFMAHDLRAYPVLLHGHAIVVVSVVDSRTTRFPAGFELFRDLGWSDNPKALVELVADGSWVPIEVTGITASGSGLSDLSFSDASVRGRDRLEGGDLAFMLDPLLLHAHGVAPLDLSVRVANDDELRSELKRIAAPINLRDLGRNGRLEGTLELRSESGRPGTLITDRFFVALGRDASNDICFDSANVSGVHVVVVLKSDGYQAYQMSRKNKVEHRIAGFDPRVVEPGDHVTGMRLVAGDTLEFGGCAVEVVQSEIRRIDPETGTRTEGGVT